MSEPFPKLSPEELEKLGFRLCPCCGKYFNNPKEDEDARTNS